MSVPVEVSVVDSAKPPIFLPGGPPPDRPVDAIPAPPTQIDFAEAPPVYLQIWNGIGSAAEWVFGAISMVVGLGVLASVPILQVLSLGYLLEVAGRIARTG